ncbi:MAG: hypothetical protein PF479_14570 [Oceanispirochaeta sp.]|nr:hypothetical protein [Oceanispirochaeta sp.]MDA3957942.1 hypothetical protein [Oceanispirochaeta sp.]
MSSCPEWHIVRGSGLGFLLVLGPEGDMVSDYLALLFPLPSFQDL